LRIASRRHHNRTPQVDACLTGDNQHHNLAAAAADKKDEPDA
jgi:putative NIF3 family GTP cyclohydrolase 1 type 2